MTGNNDNQNVNNPPANPLNDVLGLVKETINGSAATVKEKLINLLVDRELDNRVALLDTGFKKYQEMQTELRKIKPDVEATFDAAGNQVDAPKFSSKGHKALKEAQEKLDKFSKALEKALVEGDFSKLKEQVK